MKLTEKEASKLMCPLMHIQNTIMHTAAMQRPGELVSMASCFSSCLTASCMLWRWNSNHDELGYCGLGGKPEWKDQIRRQRQESIGWADVEETTEMKAKVIAHIRKSEEYSNRVMNAAITIIVKKGIKYFGQLPANKVWHIGSKSIAMYEEVKRDVGRYLNVGTLRARR